MLDISTEEMRLIVDQLDQAIYNHDQWSKRLVRTLICALPADIHDLAPDAHQHCLFGQWYYNRASARLQQMPGFVAIAVEHEHMHEHAAELLRLAANGATIAPMVYDTFENVLDRLRLQINTLRREFDSLMVNRDPLTGVNSRLGLLTALREYHEMVKRGTQQCAIAMMDLDHFKAINDDFGHPAGDAVLAESARYVVSRGLYT